VAYFSVAKIYALATDRALQRWLAFGVKPGTAGTHVQLMPVLVESTEPLGDAMLKKLRRQLELACSTPNDVETLKGAQSGIWGLFGDMVVVSWVYADTQQEYATLAKQDASNLATRLPEIISNIGLPASTPVRYTIHEGKLTGDGQQASQWRALFAQAILKLEHPDAPKGQA
jgi:hypothetical protein